MEWKLDQLAQTPAGVVAWDCTGSGPPMVLAHGWPWSSYSWHRVIAELAAQFTVFWYDMPGYGRSEMFAGQRTNLDVQGRIFSFMLDDWKLKNPRVLAHDFGGAAVLRAHLLHGCDFERLVLMNVVAMRPWGSEFFEHVGNHIDAFTGLPPDIHEAIVRAYIRGALVSQIAPDVLDGLAAPWLSQEGRRSFYLQFAEADERYTAEVEPRFGEVRCPTKIIWGEDDPWIPIARGQALSRLMPRAGLSTIPNVGHLPQLEAPDRVVSELKEFL